MTSDKRLCPLRLHPSLHRKANGFASPVLLSCWAGALVRLSNFILQSREPSTSRRARKSYTIVFTTSLSLLLLLSWPPHLPLTHGIYFMTAWDPPLVINIGETRWYNF